MATFQREYEGIPEHTEVLKQLIRHATSPTAGQPDEAIVEFLTEFLESKQFATLADDVGVEGPEQLGEALWEFARGTREELEQNDEAIPGCNYYELDAEHYRFHSKWTGCTHSVRVTLPEEPGPTKIETPIGDVLMTDHLAEHPSFARSNHRAWYKGDLRRGYFSRFRRAPPAFDRVDMITGVRRSLIPGLPYNRFSPLTVLLALDGNTPVFYALESGGFEGQSGRVHYAPNMDSDIMDPIGFKPTLFTNQQWHYRGRLDIDENGEPERVQVYVSVDPDSPTHFRAKLAFKCLGHEKPCRLAQINRGAELNQLRAILLQCAIAQGVGYRVPQTTPNPQAWRALMNLLAEIARKPNLLVEWDSVPPARPGIDRIEPEPRRGVDERQV